MEKILRYLVFKGDFIIKEEFRYTEAFLKADNP